MGDRQQLLQIVRRDGLTLLVLSSGQQDDDEIVEAAVSNNGRSLEFASQRLRNDPRIVRIAVQQDAEGIPIKFASEEIRNDRDFALQLVQLNPKAFLYLPAVFQNDAELAFTAISAEYSEIAPVPDHSQVLGNRNMMMVILYFYPPFLRFATSELQADRDLVLYAMQGETDFSNGNWDFLNDSISPALKADDEIALVAADQCGCVLDGWTANRDIVLRATANNASTLFRADLKSFWGDREIIRAAIDSATESSVVAGIYKIMPDHLCRDKDIALDVVNQDCNNFVHLPELLRGDRDIVLAAIDAYGKAKSRRGQRWAIYFDEKRFRRFFGFASAEVRGDPEIALAAVRLDGLFLENVVLGEGRRDKEVLIAAAEQNSVSWLLAPPNLREDLDVLKAAARTNFWSVPNMTTTARDNPGVIASAIRGTDSRNVPVIMRQLLGPEIQRKLQEFSEKYPTPELFMLDETVNRELWAQERKQTLWENIWLLHHIISNENTGTVSLPRDVKNHILLFTGIPSDFLRIKHTVEIGSVVQALNEKNLALATLLQDDN